MSRTKIAVVGVGHLGKEHARILSTLDGVELVGVVDANPAQRDAIAAKCNTRGYARHEDLPDDTQAAVIAAPTVYHHAVARDLIRRGVHLLIEKPLAANHAQAAELVELADEHGVTIQVGHIERFNPAFEDLKNRTSSPRYISAERCSGFTGRSTDVGAVLDLMIHDIDLVLALADSEVADVKAFGVAVLGGHEDIVQARLTFKSGCIADVSASRVHHEAVRAMKVWSAEGFAAVDFGKRVVNLIQQGDALRQGRMDSRRLDQGTLATIKNDLFTRHLQTASVDCSQRHAKDQLTRELEDFAACVRDGTTPRVDGRAGLAAMDVASRILDAVRVHAWDGRGNSGPAKMLEASGRLFAQSASEAA